MEFLSNPLVLLTTLASLITISWLIIVAVRWWRNRVPKRISWRKTEKAVLDIIHDMRQDNWIPDVVIGIGRSGAILGGMIPGNMGNIPIALRDRILIRDTRERRSSSPGFAQVTLDSRCSKVLLVIGEIRTGQSVRDALVALDPQ